MSSPLPETTRVRGGGSARIGAVVVAVVLVAIVWVGISGRPNPPPISAIPPVATAAAPSGGLGLSSARPDTAVPTPDVTRAPTPEPPETYGASLAMGNVRYVTILSELQPGHLTGELHFPSPPLWPTGTFTFSELWHDGQVEGAVAIDEWAIDLQALASATRTAATLVEASVPAQRSLLGVPPPVTSGYEINVVGRNDLLFGQLLIDVRLGANRGNDDGAAAKLRFGVTVDVGNAHQSVILSPGENGSFKATLTLPKPRRAVSAQFRLSNVQLTASHGLWSDLEEFRLPLTPDLANVGVSKLVLEAVAPTYRLVVRTNGNVRGQSITVTVICRRVTPSE
jgi:hypothetical protein